MTTPSRSENFNHRLRSAAYTTSSKGVLIRRQEARRRRVGSGTPKSAWRVLFLNRFKVFAFFPTGRREQIAENCPTRTRKLRSSGSQEVKQRNVANQAIGRRRNKASSSGKNLHNQGGSVVTRSVHQVGSAVLKDHDSVSHTVSGDYRGGTGYSYTTRDIRMSGDQCRQVKLGRFASLPTSGRAIASDDFSQRGETELRHGKETSIQSLQERGRHMSDDRSNRRSEGYLQPNNDPIVDSRVERAGAAQLASFGGGRPATDLKGTSSKAAPHIHSGQQQKVSNHKAPSMLQTHLPLALVRKTIRAETIAAIRKLGVRDADGNWSVSESEVAQVKRAFKEDLNIPDIFAIHIFTSPSGEGVLVNEHGEEVIDGCLLMEGVRGSVTFLALEVVCATSSIYIDGELVDSTEVPRRLSSLHNSLRGPRTLSEIVDFADARAQAIAFLGFINDTKDHREVLVMQNCIAPNDYHVFVGTPEAMTPIDLEPRAAGFEHNFGVMLKGRSTTDGSAALLLIPANDSPFIKPSFNGKEVLPERLSRSGEPVLIGQL